MPAKEFDLVIVGGGPGGYVGAIRAAQLGFKVALVEREHLGGICLNWGCIPTKALLRTAEVKHLLENAKDFGFAPVKVEFEIKNVVKRSRRVSRRLSAGVKHLMKKNNIEVVDGTARLSAPGRLLVETKDGEQELAAPHIIFATGARARDLPDLEADGKLIWSYKEAMVPETMPATLLVIGSGAIGMEFASFYQDMGTQVTVLESVDRILPIEDEEISTLAEKIFKKQGMTIHTAATLRTVTKKNDNVEVTFEAGEGEAEKLEVDRVILAVGIRGNVESLGLEEAGVKIENTHIVTNEWGETGVAGIYAIGDVSGPPWLAHKASHESIVCVEHIAGIEGTHPLQALNIPGCTYCRPQIASVGLTEAQATDHGYQVKVGRFPFIGNGKAIALGDSEGLVKTVFDAQSGELLGAHMIGPEVTELIQGYVVAKTLESTEAELMSVVFPHPTLSETMHESVLDAFDRALHM